MDKDTRSKVFHILNPLPSTTYYIDEGIKGLLTIVIWLCTFATFVFAFTGHPERILVTLPTAALAFWVSWYLYYKEPEGGPETFRSRLKKKLDAQAKAKRR